MSIFFELPEEGFEPVFENESIDIKIAMVLAKKFSQSLENLPFDKREDIPHAICCIYHKDTEFFICNDSIDQIREEEKILAPPESKYTPGWRKKEQRLVYLVVQLFYALVVGKLPGSKVMFLPSKILCHLSENNMILIKEFFHYGLEEDLSLRYQSLDELQDSIDVILRRLALQNTKRLEAPITARKTQTLYISNIKMYNLISQKTGNVELYAPAKLNFGRKMDTENKKLIVDIGVAQVYEWFDDILQTKVFDIIIPDDNCISRHHSEIYLDKNIENSTISDLGSTHGTIVYTDPDCDQSNSIVLNNNSVRFISKYNQYLQVGNTKINIMVKVK